MIVNRWGANRNSGYTSIINSSLDYAALFCWSRDGYWSLIIHLIKIKPLMDKAFLSLSLAQQPVEAAF